MLQLTPYNQLHCVVPVHFFVPQAKVAIHIRIHIRGMCSENPLCAEQLKPQEIPKAKKEVKITGTARKLMQIHTLTTAVPVLDTEFPLLVVDRQRSLMTSWRREMRHAQKSRKKSSISSQPGSLKTFTD